MPTIVLKQISFVRHLDRHIHDRLYAEFHMYVDWCTLYVNAWMPLGEPIFTKIFKYLLVQTVNFKSERYDETRVLTLCTLHISNLQSSLPLKISTFQCTVYAINVVITEAVPPESQQTSVQNRLFKNNMIYGNCGLPPFRQSQC